jgi:hypothetical protein
LSNYGVSLIATYCLTSDFCRQQLAYREDIDVGEKIIVLLLFSLPCHPIYCVSCVLVNETIAAGRSEIIVAGETNSSNTMVVDSTHYKKYEDL